MANTLCPYCVRKLDDDDVVVTDEHVFPMFLGGRAKIPACKSCNDWIGSDVEGPLSNPPAFMAMQAGALTGKGPIIRFEHDGRQMETDYSSGSFRSHNPVERTVDGTTTTYSLGGNEEQVRKIVEGLAAKHGFDPDKVMALASIDTITELDPSFDLDYDNEAQLAAKVALAAGTWAYGDPFINSELADRLRHILRGDDRPPYETIDKITDWESNPLYRVVEGHRRCLMIALPPDGDLPARTLVLVHLVGRAVPAFLCLVVRGYAPGRLTMVYEGGSDLPITGLDGFIAKFVVPKPDPEWVDSDEEGPVDLDPIALPEVTTEDERTID